MATTTKSAKKFSPRTIVKAEVAILFLLLVAVGFFFGRITAPVKVETVTVTELVEVPAPSTDGLLDKYSKTAPSYRMTVKEV